MHFLAEEETDSERVGSGLSSHSLLSLLVWSLGLTRDKMCALTNKLKASVLSGQRRGNGVLFCGEQDSDLSELEFPPFQSGAGCLMRGWWVPQGKGSWS